jgi:hypothetical protein
MSTTLSEEFTVCPAAMGDLDAALALFNACSIAYTGKARLEETELRGDWEMPGFDLEKESSSGPLSARRKPARWST